MSLAPARQMQMPAPSVPCPTRGIDAAQCLEAIRAKDPAAAHILYTMYADPIRGYLRRHTGIADVEHTVLSILIEAVRSARDSGESSLDGLSQTVRELCQQGVFALRRKALLHKSFEARSELVNGLFSVLDSREREILLRSSLLSEGDKEISTGLALPIHEISRTRAKARVLLRISSQPRPGYDAPATA